MDRLERLAIWLGITRDEASRLLDVLAWVEQRALIARRGFPSDEPVQRELHLTTTFARELLDVALDFELDDVIVYALCRRAEIISW